MVTKEHVLDDATDFSWVSAKASHAVLLCRMEQGEIAGWQETENLTGLGEPMHKGMLLVKVALKERRTKVRVEAECFPVFILTKVPVCRSKLMRNKGVTYRHICSHCWNKEGKLFSHPQVECRRFRGNAKNDVQKTSK